MKYPIRKYGKLAYTIVKDRPSKYRGARFNIKIVGDDRNFYSYAGYRTLHDAKKAAMEYARAHKQA